MNNQVPDTSKHNFKSEIWKVKKGDKSTLCH